MSEKCVFCKIISGELPCVKIYETGDTLAFLDISPIEKGHALVIPKAHWPTLMEAPDEDAGRVIAVARRVAAAQMACGAEGVAILQANHAAAGQVVPHLHFHLIPRGPGADSKNLESGAGAYASDAERDEYAARLRAAMEGVK